MNMKTLLLAASCCLLLTSQLAAEQTGVDGPVTENVGIVTATGDSTGSLTIGKTRYQLSSFVIIHSGDGEAVSGYRKFKFKDGMNVKFIKDKVGKNYIKEIWVTLQGD